MSELRSRAEQAGATLAESTAADMAAALQQKVGVVGPGQLVPAVDDSGIEADPAAPVHVAWSRVMAEVEYIKKGRSPGLNYEFRGIDAVLNAVGPALRKHGVLVFPIKVTPEYTVATSSGGKALTYCRVVVQYTIMGPRGDVMMTSSNHGGSVPLIVESLGEAFDTGDKASTKAQSVALRTFYINTLAIATDEPARDPEYGEQHELGAPAPRTAESYVAEILADSTSLNRLNQIKAELYGNRELGSTEVEMADGEKLRLVDLLRRVGQSKAAG